MTDIVKIIKRIQIAKNSLVTRDDTIEKQKANEAAFNQLTLAMKELSELIDDGK